MSGCNFCLWVKDGGKKGWWRRQKMGRRLVKVRESAQVCAPFPLLLCLGGNFELNPRLIKLGWMTFQWHQDSTAGPAHPSVHIWHADWGVEWLRRWTVEYLLVVVVQISESPVPVGPEGKANQGVWENTCDHNMPQLSLFISFISSLFFMLLLGGVELWILWDVLFWIWLRLNVFSSPMSSFGLFQGATETPTVYRRNCRRPPWDFSHQSVLYCHHAAEDKSWQVLPRAWCLECSIQITTVNKKER